MKVPSRGGSACAFAKDTELSRHCLELPCSRGEIEVLKLNRPAERSTITSPAAARNLDVDIISPGESFPIRSILTSSVYWADTRASAEGRISQRTTSFEEAPVTIDDSASPEELQAWQDDLLDTSTQVPLGVDGMASATMALKSTLDMWHLRIAFASVAGQSSSATARVASFEFSLTVVDDAGDKIHTWETTVPPSPAAQSIWEAMDLRLYRAKELRIEAAQPFRIAEVQVFGMPLPQCPPGGFLGPASCEVPTVQRLRLHSSLDCQGAWSEWTACQADCRRKRQATWSWINLKKPVTIPASPQSCVLP